MANIHFRCHDSQSVRKVELFIIWYALTDQHVDMDAFIISHLEQVAKTIHINVIDIGHTITSTAKMLNYEGKFGSLEPHFIGRVLNLSCYVT